MTYHGKITGHEIKRFAHQLFLETLGFVSLTAFTPVRFLIDMLLFTAVSRTSFEQANKNSKKFPSSKTLRDHIRHQLSSLQNVEEHLNTSLCATLPKSIYQKPQPIAIDLVQVPYYGKNSIHPDSIRRTPRKNGTSRCHSYATACCVRKGNRYTLAIVYVRKNEKMSSVLKRLLERLNSNKINIYYFLLDREFYGVDVINWLTEKGISFIMPAKMNSKELKKQQKVKRSGVFSYEIKSPKAGKIRVKMVRYCFELKGKEKVHIYATNGLYYKSSEWVKETYRKRFGVEVSYRQRNEMKIKTCSQDEKVRYLYVGVGFILRNVWELLHEEVFSRNVLEKKGEEPRVIFSVERMKSFLRSVLESEYGRCAPVEFQIDISKRMWKFPSPLLKTLTNTKSLQHL